MLITSSSSASFVWPLHTSSSHVPFYGDCTQIVNDNMAKDAEDTQDVACWKLEKQSDCLEAAVGRRVELGEAIRRLNRQESHTHF